MKKIFLTVLISLLLISQVSYAIAQEGNSEFNYQRAHEDYIFKRDQYRNLHNQYQIARAAYSASGTFQLRERAEDATLQMLIARDELLKAYITALRMRIAEIPEIEQSDRAQLYADIDSEVLWYDNHKNTYLTSDALEDLVRKSNVASDRHTNVTEMLYYKAQYHIALGKMRTIRREEKELFDQVKSEIERVKANGDKDTTVIERWLSDIENGFEKSSEREGLSRGAMDGISSDRRKLLSSYRNGMRFLNESHSYVIQIAEYLGQIIQELQRAD